uniref:Uncharacterized protein n=1 Tax=Eutreptiella gymnastica TaxID=73025 RepID=A0A7S1J9X0_9EUGL|mmetsp:Transcript_78008/g.137585  ORF Transcript_78008/g.137585 Transcript_78008/m.137585 type:complete len:884 (+) Transcript_78008:57-2708(+)
MRHWQGVWKEARFAPWTKYTAAEIEQLAALRRLYQKHFNVVLEVVEPTKKDKAKAAQNVMTGAVAGGVVGGVAGEVTSMATPAAILPGHGMAMAGAGAGAMVGGGVMALREKGKPVPDHNQEHLFHAGIHQLLLVDKKGYPVLNEATAKEKLENMGEIVSSNSLTYNVNSVLQHIQRYVHHDRTKGIRNMAFKANDPRCIFCMIIVEWLHKELIPCPDADRESRLLPQLDSWIKLMKDISAHNVFSTAEAYSDKGWSTMDALLLNIDQQFQQMRCHIEAEVRERSISDQLRNVSNIGKTLLGRLFQFAAYVLSPIEDMPPFFGINAFYQTIKRPDLVKYVRSNPHGRLMAEVAHAYEVQEYLDVWPDEENKDPYVLLKPFQDKQEGAVVEALLYIVHQRRLPDDGDVDRLLKTRVVASLFGETDRTMLINFLRLHVQLPVLTRLMLACKEASFLAGSFGELMFLRNENSRKILEFLVEGTISLATALRDDLESLWTKASNIRRRNRVDHSGKSAFKIWESNWQQAYHIYSGMGTENDINQQVVQIVTELTRVQTKLRNPAANLPQVRYRLNQFVQLLDTVRDSCPWLPVDAELKSMIQQQAGYLASELQRSKCQLPPQVHSANQLPPTSLPPGLENKKSLTLALWTRHSAAEVLDPTSSSSDKTYTIEDALKESLAAEIEARAKVERDLSACRKMWDDRSAEWDRERQRLTQRIGHLVMENSQLRASNRPTANADRWTVQGAMHARAKTDIATHAPTRNTGATHARTRTEESRAPASFPSPVQSPGVSPPVSPGRGMHQPLLHDAPFGDRDSHRRPRIYTPAMDVESTPSDMDAQEHQRQRSFSSSMKDVKHQVKKVTRSMSAGCLPRRRNLDAVANPSSLVR